MNPQPQTQAKKPSSVACCGRLCIDGSDGSDERGQRQLAAAGECVGGFAMSRRLRDIGRGNTIRKSQHQPPDGFTEFFSIQPTLPIDLLK
jgi:hypothetical protein